MAGNNTQFLPSLRARKTVHKNGEYYASYAEHQFQLLLELFGEEAEHDCVSFEIDKKHYYYQDGRHQTRYTPDYTQMRCKNGIAYMTTVDVKGKDFECDSDAQRVAQIMIDVIHNTDFCEVRSFALVYKDKIRYYDIDTTDINKPKSASYYLCPECGRFEILPDSDHKCSRCGAESEKAIKNNAYIKYVQSKAKNDQMLHRTEWEKRAKERLFELGKLAGIEFLEEDDVFQIAYPELNNEHWRPDFAYDIQPTSIPSFNTAPKVQSIISCIENIKDYEKMMNYLAAHAANKESMIRQAVFCTPDGILIAEYNNRKLNPGGAYKCDKCGKGFFSVHHDSTCPFCLSKDTHEVKRKKKSS